MKKFITTFGLLLTITSLSWACRCMMDEAKLFYFVDSEYVFRAEVESVSDCGDNNKYEYRLEIEDAYKGDLEDEITVYSDCITSCAFQLEVGKTYIFFTDLINNNIGFCEYRVEKGSDDYKNAKAYLDKIADTKLDFLTIKDNKHNTMGTLQISNGKLDGLVKVFYPDGEMRMRGMFIKGIPSGGFEFTEMKGRLKETWKGDYKDGKRIGLWVRAIFASDEKKYEHIYYEDGEIVDRYMIDLDSQVERFAPEKN